MRNWFLGLWILLSLSAITLKAAEPNALTPFGDKLSDPGRGVPQEIQDAIAKHEQAKQAAQEKIDALDIMIDHYATGYDELADKYNDRKTKIEALPEGEEKKQRLENLKSTERQLEKMRGAIEQVKEQAKVQEKLKDQADADLTKAKESETRSKDPAAIMADLRDKFDNMDLKTRFDKLEIKGLSLEEKIEALERELDQSIMGAYVREKITRVLTSEALCEATKLCGKHMSPEEKRKALEADISQMFHDNEGNLGRHLNGSHVNAPDHSAQETAPH